MFAGSLLVHWNRTFLQEIPTFVGNMSAIGRRSIRRWAALNSGAHVDRLCTLIGEMVFLIEISCLPLLAL